MGMRKTGGLRPAQKMIPRLLFVRANQFDYDRLPLAFGFENAPAFGPAEISA
jgi:hypothetical protein